MAYIFKCEKSTLQIKGKINSITVGRQNEGHVFAVMSCATETCHVPLLEFSLLLLDNCKKFGLVFDNVVGIVEVINSKDIQIQVSSLYSHALHCHGFAWTTHLPAEDKGRDLILCPPRKHPVPLLSKHSSIISSLGEVLSLFSVFFPLPFCTANTCLILSISQMANKLGT